MVKFILRVITYFIVFVLIQRLFTGVEGTIAAFLLLALVLALANGIIRPVLTFIALPFNIITFGIASVFVNILTLLISDAIVAQVSIAGFWMLALISVLIMAVDTLMRVIRLSNATKIS